MGQGHGHHNLRFDGDPYANAGVWSPPTATANFCEEDYAVTPYIAEFVNTLTNVAYIYFALRYPCRPGKGRPPRRFDFMSISLVVLGFNSMLFHGTLRHGCQFADELSMLLLAGALLQPLLVVGQAAVVSTVVTAAITLVLVASSIIYIRSADILFHSFVFVAMLTMVWPRILVLIYRRGRSAEEKRRLIGMFRTGFFALLVAYAAWNLDLEKCLELRRFREKLGIPWSWLFEFHGWWHVLTALAASQFVRLIRELCDY